MNTEKFIIYNDNYHKLCKIAFKVLNCNALWMMNLGNNTLSMLVTDPSILEHYWDKKYYLHDPVLGIKPSSNRSPWKVTLGTDCDIFNKSGFLYDLYKMFHIEEFVSIEKKVGSEFYCFRFFTKNNRFVFVNKLLNNMPIIKHFINTMAKKCKKELHKQPGIKMMELMEDKED